MLQVLRLLSYANVLAAIENFLIHQKCLDLWPLRKLMKIS